MALTFTPSELLGRIQQVLRATGDPAAAAWVEDHAVLLLPLTEQALRQAGRLRGPPATIEEAERVIASHFQAAGWAYKPAIGGGVNSYLTAPNGAFRLQLKAQAIRGQHRGDGGKGWFDGLSYGGIKAAGANPQDLLQRGEIQARHYAANAPAVADDVFRTAAVRAQVGGAQGLTVRVQYTPQDGLTVDGDTRPLREVLRAHGLKWDGEKTRWYLPGSRGRGHAPPEAAGLAEALQARGVAVQAHLGAPPDPHVPLKAGAPAERPPPPAGLDPRFLDSDTRYTVWTMVGPARFVVERTYQGHYIRNALAADILRSWYSTSQHKLVVFPAGVDPEIPTAPHEMRPVPFVGEPGQIPEALAWLDEYDKSHDGEQLAAWVRQALQRPASDDPQDRAEQGRWFDALAGKARSRADAARQHANGKEVSLAWTRVEKQLRDLADGLTGKEIVIRAKDRWRELGEYAKALREAPKLTRKDRERLASLQTRAEDAMQDAGVLGEARLKESGIRAAEDSAMQLVRELVTQGTRAEAADRALTDYTDLPVNPRPPAGVAVAVPLGALATAASLEPGRYGMNQITCLRVRGRRSVLGYDLTEGSFIFTTQGSWAAALPVYRQHLDTPIAIPLSDRGAPVSRNGEQNLSKAPADLATFQRHGLVPHEKGPVGEAPDLVNVLASEIVKGQITFWCDMAPHDTVAYADLLLQIEKQHGWKLYVTVRGKKQEHAAGATLAVRPGGKVTVRYPGTPTSGGVELVIEGEHLRPPGWHWGPQGVAVGLSPIFLARALHLLGSYGPSTDMLRLVQFEGPLGPVYGLRVGQDGTLRTLTVVMPVRLD